MVLGWDFSGRFGLMLFFLKVLGVVLGLLVGYCGFSGCFWIGLFFTFFGRSICRVRYAGFRVIFGFRVCVSRWFNSQVTAYQHSHLHIQ